MKAKNKRLLMISFLLASFFLGCILLFLNLRENLIYFYSPTEINEKKNEKKEKIRVGGMVSKGSVERVLVMKNDKKLEKINFEITDFKNSVRVNYIGILPDLFKEEQGVVVEGIFKNQVFLASKVLAKHDENYMPPEIKEMQIHKDLDNDR
tara:strand:+ start:2125 stop:2577 length:453 start_codon:yes stop_codon:yes gene_type:complete